MGPTTAAEIGNRHRTLARGLVSDPSLATHRPARQPQNATDINVPRIVVNRSPRLTRVQCCSTDGIFVWADVFRDPHESRPAFLQRYSERVRSSWHQLTAEQRRRVIGHLSTFDIPADRAAIQAAAAAAGWQWRWSWQGAHRAEALAVLTPI